MCAKFDHHLSHLQHFFPPFASLFLQLLLCIAFDCASSYLCIASNWARCFLIECKCSLQFRNPLGCFIGWQWFIVKGFSHFFLMGFIQNPPHVPIQYCALNASLKRMHHLSTIGFYHYFLLVVVCPLHSEVLSSWPVFLKEPNNILLPVNNTKNSTYL